MSSKLSRLQSPAAIQAVMDEFSRLGRTAFLERYSFGKSRDYLVKNPVTGALCDSKAIIGAAFGFQFPLEGPLTVKDFSGGDATVVQKLQSLGFEVVRIGEDWSEVEVRATVASYFEMLRFEAQQKPYNKAELNAELRRHLQGRSKASVELKHQNISAILHSVGFPFIPGYKPRGNSQLLLRQEVQKFILGNSDLLAKLVDALEEVKTPTQQTFKAVLVDPPPMMNVMQLGNEAKNVRLPRKVDFAARDENNRRLGRAGEQWAIEFEHQRLIDAGQPDLFSNLEWVSDKLGDGAGFDILSYNAPSQPRYIEVKTTNGSHASAFIISRNEVDFSKEVGDSFFLYRVFRFRESPALYMLHGDISTQLHLEPMDYRASFRRVMS